MNATTWYWPGRFLFDAIQHRWNKWVLDYSFQIQFNLFERSREVVTGSNRLDPSPTDEPAGRGRWGLIGWGVGILLALSALFWGTRNGAGATQETRIFLRLKEACRRAGVPKGSLRSPMSITGYLESVRHPAAPAARRVVDGYLRARFSGLWVRTEEEREVRKALSEARAYLRRPAFKV